MSSQLLDKKVVDNIPIIPPLEDSKWQMYNFNGHTISISSWKQHFTTNNKVHDEDEVWEGTWEKVTDGTIIIHRKDIGSSARLDYYVTFPIPNYFIVVEENHKIVNSGYRQ